MVKRTLIEHPPLSTASYEFCKDVNRVVDDEAERSESPGIGCERSCRRRGGCAIGL